jgi:hypothetical protein
MSRMNHAALLSFLDDCVLPGSIIVWPVARRDRVFI